MTAAPAAPAMTAQAPSLAAGAPPVGQAPAAGLLPSFASLVGAPQPGDTGTPCVKELPPEVVALLLAALMGTQVPAVAAAPATTVQADTSPAGDVAAPAAEAMAIDSGAALALDAMLDDAVARGRQDPADLLRAEAAPVRSDPGAPKDFPHWAAAALDAPQAPKSPHESTPKHSLPVHTHVAAQGWADEVAARIAWITREDFQSATLRLTPEHLGPVDVTIAVRDGDAIVTFGAGHAETRAALEQALPRLRELFAAQGLSLSQASVSGERARRDPPATRHVAGPEIDMESHHDDAVRMSLGLVDLYA